MPEIEPFSLLLIRQVPCRGKPEKDRQERHAGETAAVHPDRQKNQRGLTEKREGPVKNRGGDGFIFPNLVQGNEILDADIDEYQGPGDVVLRSEEHPGQTCPLSDVIKQVHVDKEEDVVTHAVPAKKIDVKRGEIPDLDDCQR